jgi:hypothetical protein
MRLFPSSGKGQPLGALGGQLFIGAFANSSADTSATGATLVSDTRNGMTPMGGLGAVQDTIQDGGSLRSNDDDDKPVSARYSKIALSDRVLQQVA